MTTTMAKHVDVNELLKQRSSSEQRRALDQQGLYPPASPMSHLSSRASFDSEIWTASVVGQSPSLSEVEYIATPHGAFRGHSFESTESPSGSEYSPSMASIREAVIRSPVLDPISQEKPALQRPTVISGAQHGLAIRIDPTDNMQPIPKRVLQPSTASQATRSHQYGSQFAGTAPTRRHSSIDSTTSVSSSNEDTPLAGFGSLLPGPAKNQRMQSFLAPKMKIISPAPWDDERNSCLKANTEGRPSAKARQAREAMSRSTRSSSDTPPTASTQQVAAKPTILMRRKTDNPKSTGPMSISTFPPPKGALPPIPGARVPHRTPEERSDPLCSPGSSPATTASMPRSSSLTSGTEMTSSTSQSSLGSANTATDSSSSPTSAKKVAITAQASPFSLISLDAARERERKNPFPSEHQLDERRKISTDTVDSSTSSNAPKMLKSKKSGFLKLFNRREEFSNSAAMPAMPLPVPQAHPNVLRSAPPNISTFAQAERSHSVERATPAQQPPRSPNVVSFLSPPATNPQDRINKPGSKDPILPAPTLSLRPISMAFSHNFAQNLLVNLQEEKQVPRSPLSEAMQSESTASYFVSATRENTPSTPLFPSSASDPNGISPSSTMQDKLSDAQQSWKTQMWEMEQQVNRLETEVDALRAQRDALIRSGNGKPCETCGCTCGNDTGASSILFRPRPVPDGETRVLF